MFSDIRDVIPKFVLRQQSELQAKISSELSSHIKSCGCHMDPPSGNICLQIFVPFMYSGVMKTTEAAIAGKETAEK